MEPKRVTADEQKYPYPARKELNSAMTRKELTHQARSPSTFSPKGFSLKKSRGDWTPLELFVAGVRGWEGHLRKQVRNGSPFLE
jgi:hypothetical protein